MVAVRGVLWRTAQRVQGGELIFVSVMEGGKDANWKAVVKALKVVQISARPMGEGRGAHGANLVLCSVKVMVCVIHLQGARLGFVHLMVHWCRINGFMGVPPWGPWFKI